MRSKKGFLAVVAVSLALGACAYSEKPATDHSEDNIVGQNLSSVSSVTSETGSDNAKIAMYDSVVCRIHQFDMSTGTHQRTLKPTYLGGNHKVMFDPNGNYVIDVVDAHLTIFNKDGLAQDPQVSFVGAPKNASFRPSLGYMVMQDDSKTAALIKIDSAGTVAGHLSLGQIVYSGVTLLAGDIDDSGKLILALSDGNIAVIDIAQTIANGDWAIDYKFASGLSGINWLAPMHDGSHQILAKTREDGSGNTTIAVFDTLAKAQVGASYVVPSNSKVIKTSKLYDPHFIVQDDGSSQSTIIYVQGSAIQTVPVTNPIRNVLSSRISVANNSWSIVDTDIWKIWDGWNWYNRIVFDDYNIVQSNRLFQKFSLNRMVPLIKYTVPDTTQIQIGENKIFQLYPAKLGWAVSNTMSNPGDAQNITQFNAALSHYDSCH